MTEAVPAPPNERFKCETCNINFYKRYQTHKQCQNSLDQHVKKQCHRHNVERAAMGLPPERVYNLTAASRRLGELVERLGDRVEQLEGVIRHERCRSESEGSQETSRPSEGRPFAAADEQSVVTESEPETLASSSFAPTATSSHQLPLRLQIREKPLQYFQENRRPHRQHVQRWVDQLDDYSVDTIEEDTEGEEELSPRNSQYSRDLGQSNTRWQTPTRLEASTEATSFRQFGPMMSRTHAFKPTESEAAAVYGYDGKNYSLMQQSSNMLQRVLIWVKQNLSGDRLSTNVAFIQRTHAALNTQMRQRLNSEPTDDDDTDIICSRLYNILEHDFES